MDKRALYKFSSGLYVVSAATDEERAGCVINTGLQLTGDPLQVQVVVNKQNHTEGVIERAGHFALTVISMDATMDFIGRFGFQTSATVDKFDGITAEQTVLGDWYTPECSCAMLACKVVQTLDVGTHMLFVGEVVDAAVLSGAEPITYAYYHSTLKGKTPPKASSYVAEDKPEQAAAPDAPVMHHFRCVVCGHIEETPLEELPEDFSCPICGVGRDMFEKID